MIEFGSPLLSFRIAQLYLQVQFRLGLLARRRCAIIFHALKRILYTFNVYILLLIMLAMK